LKGERHLTLRQDSFESGNSNTSKVGRNKRNSRHNKDYDIPDHEQDLWQALRECRTQLARAQGIAPFMIFHDATLKSMLQVKPKDHTEFSSLSGVGQKKLDQYGPAFLQVLAEFNPN
jgi:ATP-dependent DNA helicase RecQ